MDAQNLIDNLGIEVAEDWNNKFLIQSVNVVPDKVQDVTNLDKTVKYHNDDLMWILEIQSESALKFFIQMFVKIVLFMTYDQDLWCLNCTIG